MNNFPIGQFYDIAVDMRDPYWVYGGLQDNHSFMGPSRTRRWAGILNDDWMESGFSDGTSWEADPRSAHFTYGSSSGGNYFRYDAYTGDILDINPVRARGRGVPLRLDVARAPVAARPRRPVRGRQPPLHLPRPRVRRGHAPRT